MKTKEKRLKENGTISKSLKNSRNLSVFFISLATLLFMMSFVDCKDKWKIAGKEVNTSTFELHAGQSAIYTGSTNGGNFKNFSFRTHISHTEGTKASLWFHTDAKLSKGYSVLIGNPTDDHRRSGSLASVRNLYKPVSSSFDLEVKVEGKRIVVMIDSFKVVDYLEPAAPYRTATNASQLLSNGMIGFRVENGTLNVANAGITPLADNLPDYPAEKKPTDERDDVLIRLQQRNFPVIDYHVHWPANIDANAIMERSLSDGFEFGIAASGFGLTSDEVIKSRFEKVFIYPPLFYGMQGEGREWPKILSKEARDKFDYVFTDAMTFNDHAGRFTHLWIDSEVIIDIPEQEYMDMIMERTLKIINEEPIDFLASPTRLSTSMMKDYDKYWTDERVKQLITALKDNNVAMEINAVSKVPPARIIKAAKAAGVKFTLGTNNNGIQELDRLDYPLRMVEECGLTIDDMWFPKEKRDTWKELKAAFEKRKTQSLPKEKSLVENRQSDNEKGDYIIADVTKNYSPKKELILQDFMDVEYIPLETKDGFQNQGFVMDIGKKNIIVRNYKDNGDIFIFDRTGKALRKINRMGQGNNEYSGILWVALDEDNNEMFINDIYTKKIFVYDLYGNFKRSFKQKEDGGSIFYNDIFNYDKDNLICYDMFNEEIPFVLISKQDGSIIKDIKIPFKEKKILAQKSGEMTMSPGGGHSSIIPFKDNWLLLEHSSDTVYTFLPDYSLRPFLIRTPPIQSMDPGVFLNLRLLSDRYIFMETIKNEYDWNTQTGFPRTFFMYDKQEKNFLGYTVYNGDYTTQSEIYVSNLRPVNHEIESWQALNVRQLAAEYKFGILKGQLKEIASTLNEDSNPVIMLVKHKK
jgi:histidinol phosphatase-like PHP family hydrolase